MKIIESQTIPTPCISNHAANILELLNGDILCTWFGGSMEGSSDISVYLSRRNNETGVWSDAVKMSKDSSRSEQNPVLFRKDSDEIWLFYTAQILADQGTSLVRIRKTFDEGLTWSEETDLFPEAGTFVRQKPVINPQGYILLPIWHSNMKEAFGLDHSMVKISKDGGCTWETSEVPESYGCVHMNIMEDCKTAYYRSRKADFIYRSISVDDGLTWSVPQPTQLPNNNSSIQASIDNAVKTLIIFNDIRAAGREKESSVPPWIKNREEFLASCEITERSAVWGVPRNPLVIASSADDGKTWIKEIVIENDAALRSPHDTKGSFIGDYSYPSILLTKDGKVHIAYTYLRDYIKYVTLEM